MLIILDGGYFVENRGGMKQPIMWVWAFALFTISSRRGHSEFKSIWEIWWVLEYSHQSPQIFRWTNPKNSNFSSLARMCMHMYQTLYSIFYYIFFFFFLRNKHTHTHKGEGKGFWYKDTPQLHSKAIVNFKRGWGKLYYTQHTLLSNVGQLPILFSFFWETNIHTHKGEGKGF